MKAPFDFVIEPKGSRYNNITKEIHKTIEKHPIYSGLPLLKHTYKMFKR